MRSFCGLFQQPRMRPLQVVSMEEGEIALTGPGSPKRRHSGACRNPGGWESHLFWRRVNPFVDDKQKNRADTKVRPYETITPATWVVTAKPHSPIAGIPPSSVGIHPPSLLYASVPRRWESGLTPSRGVLPWESFAAGSAPASKRASTTARMTPSFATA